MDPSASISRRNSTTQPSQDIPVVTEPWFQSSKLPSFSLSAEDLNYALQAAQNHERPETSLHQTLKAFRIIELAPKMMSVVTKSIAASGAFMILQSVAKDKGWIFVEIASSLAFLAFAAISGFSYSYYKNLINKSPRLVSDEKTREYLEGIHWKDSQGNFKLGAEKFFSAARAATDTPQKFRALHGVVECAKRTTDPILCVEILNTLARYFSETPEAEKNNSPVYRTINAEAVRFLITKMWDSRYERLGSTEPHDWINPHSCSVLENLFKSVQLKRNHHYPDLVDKVEELRRTIGARDSESDNILIRVGKELAATNVIVISAIDGKALTA